MGPNSDEGTDSLVLYVCYNPSTIDPFMACTYASPIIVRYLIRKDKSMRVNGRVVKGKAVNREDKRSRRHRDRDFAKFERSRRYRER